MGQDSMALVEPGRLAVINFGSKRDLPVTIVDIIDQRRAIIEGPQSGIERQYITLRRLALTRFVTPDVPRGCPSVELEKKLREHNTVGKWQQTNWAKKIAIKKLRANLNDFQRFQVRSLKRQRKTIIMTKCFKGETEPRCRLTRSQYARSQKRRAENASGKTKNQ
eukprot:TRINITY_DN41642_c0_g1_i1.p1 TRINITY_DN41642_c0_g1~~TRINITY_DN41642_c0_g1_i1.p1  ORF type:complete len:165 (-),score=3.28 TRINITY_DN41642_c0_g1_i1:222-716(-)